MTNERFFTELAYYRGIVLMLSFTGSVAFVTLTSSSKTVRQHITHIRQLS